MQIPRGIFPYKFNVVNYLCMANYFYNSWVRSNYPSTIVGLFSFISFLNLLTLIFYPPLKTLTAYTRNLRMKYLHRFFLLNSSKILINFMMNLRIYIQILLFSSPPFKKTFIFIFSRLKTAKLLNYPQIACF